MLNRSASLAMSTCVLKALPGKLDIKRHSPSILYVNAGHLTLFQVSFDVIYLGLKNHLYQKICNSLVVFQQHQQTLKKENEQRNDYKIKPVLMLSCSILNTFDPH